MLGPSLRRAEHVVTVTEWLRGELLGSVPSLDPDRVVTVLEGCPSMPTPVRGRHAAATDGPPVVLFVSTLFPYKGAGELVGALAHLAAHRPELDWRARIVGADPSGGRITDELRRAIAAGGAELAGRVELVGRVPHEQIWDAYASAAVFVYPSRLETFGLPPLEAMASNVPVVASDAPAVAEVVGDAALVVDPTDAAALAGSIATALEDPEVRATLVARGRARTRALTWNAAAEQLAALLRAAAARIP